MQTISIDGTDVFLADVPQANKRRPFGAGMSRPSSRAVSSHSVITVSAFASASCRVVPSAAQPGNSGTSAINAWSSSLQYRMISYLVIELLQPVYTDEPRVRIQCQLRCATNEM